MTAEMTTISEIAPDVFSICTYVESIDLQFRQFLIRDEQPLLYHTGTRRMFERVRDAVAEVLDPASLRWIVFSHFEADECGALNYWLQEAPAQAACSANCALVSAGDYAFGKVRPLSDDETLSTGSHRLRFLATPHLPHGWDAGHLCDETAGVLFCSDLLHQTGDVAATTGESRVAAMRAMYRVPRARPLTGMCRGRHRHGLAWRGWRRCGRGCALRCTARPTSATERTSCALWRPCWRKSTATAGPLPELARDDRCQRLVA